MKTPALAVLAALLLLTPISPALHAQATPAPAGSAKSASVEDRRRALNDIFHEYWEANLKHEPEFASQVGDKRYNDKLSDYSVRAINDWLATEQNFLLQLAAIDPTGLSDQEKISREILIDDLTDDQEAAQFKEWEMPVNQMDGIYNEYPDLVTQLSFKTVKDYDDWIARLHAIPARLQPDHREHVHRRGRQAHASSLPHGEKFWSRCRPLPRKSLKTRPLAAAQKLSRMQSQQPTRTASALKRSPPFKKKSCLPTHDSPRS